MGCRLIAWKSFGKGRWWNTDGKWVRSKAKASLAFRTTGALLSWRHDQYVQQYQNSRDFDPLSKTLILDHLSGLEISIGSDGKRLRTHLRNTRLKTICLVYVILSVIVNVYDYVWLKCPRVIFHTILTLHYLCYPNFHVPRRNDRRQRRFRRGEHRAERAKVEAQGAASFSTYLYS